MRICAMRFCAVRLWAGRFHGNRRPAKGWPNRRHRTGGAVPARTGPQRGHGVDGLGDGIGSLLVVDAPADEVEPGHGRVEPWLDREVDLPHPVNGIEEFVIAEPDAALWVRLVGDREAHRPGDFVEADEACP